MHSTAHWLQVCSAGHAIGCCVECEADESEQQHVRDVWKCPRAVCVIENRVGILCRAGSSVGGVHVVESRECRELYTL